MKITYINTTGTLGGAEICLLDVLATVVAPDGAYRPSVILGADGPLRTEIEALGVPCAVLPLPSAAGRLGDAGLSGRGAGGKLALATRATSAAPATAAYLARLARALRTEAPDIVQTNGMKAHVLGAFAAPSGVPVVWHLHDYTATRPVMARLLRGVALARRGGRLHGVAVSHSVADDAAAVLGRRANLRTIYNAVDLDRFAPDAPGPPVDLDAAAGLDPPPHGTLRIGLVATFARWKGHDVFLRAIAQLRADTPPCRFYIVGGPIYSSAGSQYTADELRDLAKGLGVADRVAFSGHQADPAAAIRALDVVVHASTKPEPFGRVIVEAMACGKATIAAAAGGAAELFEDGRTALGCPPGDPAALAVAIGRLAADETLRRNLGAAGLVASRARFDRRGLAAPWSALYDDAAPQARRHTHPLEGATCV